MTSSDLKEIGDSHDAENRLLPSLEFSNVAQDVLPQTTNQPTNVAQDVLPQTTTQPTNLTQDALSQTTNQPKEELKNLDETIDPVPQTESEPAEGLMTVVEHLDELRWRIIRCVGYISVALVAMLFVTKDILKFLEAPAGNITFQALSLEEPVLVYIKVAFYCSLIAASPFILFEVARFISPGLTRKERAIMAPIVVGSPVLFVAGAAFAYYLLLPPMLHFFGSFGVGVSPINQRLDFYISLVSSIMLYLGLCFQLPILIFALSFTGIVNSRMLISIWKYAVAGITVVAAIVTPDPTAMSMLMVMAALIGLYFLSVLLLKLFGR